MKLPAYAQRECVLLCDMGIDPHTGNRLREQAITMRVDQIMIAVDIETGPEVMTKQEAVDFLTELREQIQSRIEALREEIANETRERHHDDRS